MFVLVLLTLVNSGKVKPSHNGSIKGDYKHSSTHSEPQNLMEVIAELHALAALPWEGAVVNTN